MLALAFLGPGGMHLLDAWREFQVPSSVTIALLECAAGLAVLLGWRVRWVALAPTLFLVGDAFATRAFWQAVPLDQKNQLHFFKNAALAGAFLLQSARQSAGS